MFREKSFIQQLVVGLLLLLVGGVFVIASYHYEVATLEALGVGPALAREFAQPDARTYYELLGIVGVVTFIGALATVAAMILIGKDKIVNYYNNNFLGFVIVQASPFILVLAVRCLLPVLGPPEFVSFAGELILSIVIFMTCCFGSVGFVSTNPLWGVSFKASQAKLWLWLTIFFTPVYAFYFLVTLSQLATFNIQLRRGVEEVVVNNKSYILMRMYPDKMLMREKNSGYFPDSILMNHFDKAEIYTYRNK